MIILFDSVKGGVGKSTLLSQFVGAICNQSNSKKVGVMDCDPQKSIETWSIRRYENNSYNNNFSLLDANPEDLKIYKNQFDYIFVDSAGADTETGRELLLLSDIVIAPLQATQAALDTVSQHYDILKQAIKFNPKLKIYYLLNDCSTHAKDKEAVEALELLKDFLPNKDKNIKVINDFIYSRKLLKTIYSNGGTCFDVNENKSQHEIKKIINFIIAE
ncbi:ParA family protein [Gilliamella sp. W8126]|uniref:ParA family protein n=1 Tax=Gilliamella sp. W8126 TaxID=2750946 RepID=UPI0018DBF7B1|nr:ParA family protein [Gilliamella sp. W8126]MBI0007002.1 ParA family protein [Gilliamella sp. W8126]